jgi:putative DNA methylase
MSDDKRLIEDYLPIEKISAEASREKSVRKGHISTLHLWWARRPLVACRAAVYGALVPASRFTPNGASDEKKKSLGRANAAKFMEQLCQYPGSPAIIAEAQQHILEAHAGRLTQETGEKVTVEDILEGRAPRPKVLDMFAGGGAIPLEALRLGCEAYALDLNPVAYIIELCTLVYPQKYGKPDPSARGMTGPKNGRGENTWGGLAEEVRYWGNWVLKQVKAEIGDLYPLIPEPESKGKNIPVQADWLKKQGADEVPPGYLVPVAYLWTRTVTCKNPHCRATVPLLKQTWLCEKDGRYVALKIVARKGTKQVRFEVVEARSEKGLGFDPKVGSKGGNATCSFCGTVADTEYVKAEGCAGRMATQLMAIACTRPGKQGKVYLAADEVPDATPNEKAIQRRIEKLCERTRLTVPSEPIITDAKNSCWTHLYGLTRFSDLFIPRQMLCLLAFVEATHAADVLAKSTGLSPDHRKALTTFLACVIDKLADFNSSLCVLKSGGGRGIVHTFGRQALPMVWDFAEANPFNPEIASWESSRKEVEFNARDLAALDSVGIVTRGSATTLPWDDASLDAVITDPPYYDNVPYANISDYFYIWLKRTLGDQYPEHFAAESTPKKSEAVADANRHGGSRSKARQVYEEMMGKAFSEANRVLKPTGELVVVYAHKTTLGWTTLVEALRTAGFEVTEAWPLDTETTGRLRAQDSAALASSIFLVARKRDGAGIGNHEMEVRPELEQIVRERVGTLWEMGISGADLVIACIGAGLRAFTRFARVEYANGEEVPAARFLTEVETVVLESILTRLSREVGGHGGKYSLAGLDPSTRFYVLWRYTYKNADLDAGEAIIFANGTHVELDGANGLSSRTRPLAAKNKGEYRLLDYTARGGDAALGMPSEDGQPAPVIDALHRLLWLMERQPSGLAEFLREARPNTEQLRLVAQALAGPALKGGELGEVATGTELAALTRLTANWRSVVEDVAEAAVGPLFRAARKTE